MFIIKEKQGPSQAALTPTSFGTGQFPRFSADSGGDAKN
jgi:hypothetical protein